jgi:hypothetical protein
MTLFYNINEINFNLLTLLLEGGEEKLNSLSPKLLRNLKIFFIYIHRTIHYITENGRKGKMNRLKKHFKHNIKIYIIKKKIYFSIRKPIYEGKDVYNKLYKFIKFNTYFTTKEGYNININKKEYKLDMKYKFKYNNEDTREFIIKLENITIDDI